MEDEKLENENDIKFEILGEGDLDPEITFHAPPGRNISFHSDERGKVGELNWDDGPMIFIGDAEESAKIFFDHVIRMVCTCPCPLCGDEDDS